VYSVYQRYYEHPRQKNPNKDQKFLGRIAIVTGANSGIGRQTALCLALKGHTVVLACRNRERGLAAEKALNDEVSHAHHASHAGKLVFLQLDLASLQSVETFCEQFKQRFGKLDVLVNNAGLNYSTGPSDDGFDMLFQINYLGHFHLTVKLLPLMKAGRTQITTTTNTSTSTSTSDSKAFASSPFQASTQQKALNSPTREWVLVGNDDDDQKTTQNTTQEARIVCLSSVMHHFGHTDWERAVYSYRESISSYCSSKIAMILFCRALNARLGQHGIRAIAVNPGAVRTNIWRRTPKLLMPLWDAVMRSAFLTSNQGCSTSVFGACDALEDHVDYLSPYWHPSWGSLPFDVMGPYVGAHSVNPTLPNDADKEAERLWRFSEASVRKALEAKNLQRT